MNATGEALQDRLGREIRYLRVSLTERCNFRCGFCMPPAPSVSHAERPLDCGETLRLCAVFRRLGVGNFKITGGEPFMDDKALPVMRRLKAELRADSVTVTTNGTTLDRHAGELADIGVDCVNVSLNALSPEAYRSVTGVDFPLETILANIGLAKRAGLNLKLNMVPLRGVNTRDMAPLMDFALERGIPLRFIELMPIGQGRLFRGLSLEEVRTVIEKRFGRVEKSAVRMGNGPAVYFTVPGYGAKIGYIAALSEQFCRACNRIRLTSSGFLRTCLHHSHGTDLAAPLRAGESDAALAERVRSIVLDKPGRHEFAAGAEAAQASGRDPMFRIGG